MKRYLWVIAVVILVASAAVYAGSWGRSVSSDYWIKVKDCNGCSVELYPNGSPTSSPTVTPTATATATRTSSPTPTPTPLVENLTAPESTMVQCVEQIGGNGSTENLNPGQSLKVGCDNADSDENLPVNATTKVRCGNPAENSRWTPLARGAVVTINCNSSGGSSPTPTATSGTPTPQPTATGIPPVGLNILTGTYSGCNAGSGSGCAKGDAVSGSDGTVSSNSWVLQSSSNQFTSAMQNKRITIMQTNGTATTAACGGQWSGYGCYNGVECEGTVISVQSSSQLTVSRNAQCGSGGIGFSQTGGAYWIVGNDDSSAIGNALTAAKNAGQNLVFPANYNGLVYSAIVPPGNSAIQCASGATLHQPHMTTGQTQLFKVTNSGFRIDGCTMEGIYPPGGFYDPAREYDVAIAIFSGKGTVRTDVTHNVFRSFYGTYVVGTSGANGAIINDNVFENCAYYGVQNNQSGGQNPTTQVERNSFTDCNYGSEDGAPNPSGGNSRQEILNNTFRVKNPYGTGYGHSQATIGGYSHGYVFVDPGTYASGSTPSSGQYSGVTMSGNSMQGNGMQFFAGSDCKTNKYGAVLSNNTCNNGCTCN